MDVIRENLGLLLQGLVISLEVSFLAFLLALAIGIVVATLRATTSRPLQLIGTAYTEVIRNIPLLVQLFFLYFALPTPPLNLRIPAFWCGVLALGIYTGAFVAEAIRSGILAIPRGQFEAGFASGLSYVQVMRHIVLPQAIRTTIPPLGNTTLNMIKNSSLVSTVSVYDILGAANLVGGRTFAYVPLLLFAGLLYFVLTIPTAIAVNALERRFGTGRT